jgi:hypothetical protein
MAAWMIGKDPQVMKKRWVLVDIPALVFYKGDKFSQFCRD